MTTSADIRRRKQLAAIHVAKRDLGMDDDSYRLMLREVVGVSSAKDLDAGGRRRLLDHLGSIGWQRTPKKRVAQYPGTPHNLERESMLRKIEALLTVMRLPWSYADAIAKQQTGIEKVAWLRKPDHRKAVIAALYAEQEKRGLIVMIDECLETLGWDRQSLLKHIPGLPKNWQRHRPTLRALVVQLDSLTTV